MKKPEKSLTRKKAIIKRGKKRSDRLKATQKEKTLRANKRKQLLKTESNKFQQHLDRLRGN